MGKFKSTIYEVSKVLGNNNVSFALTRFDKDSKKEPNDLDILVHSYSFDKTIKVLEENGYTSSSHDQALGGRVKGMQKNLTKPGRIKIDLHQDFTWRASRYFDVELIWRNLKTESTQGVEYSAPNKTADVFIVVINIIFEKTYLKKEDCDYIKKSLNEILENKTFLEQTKNYGWNKSFDGFTRWLKSVDNKSIWPVFLPFGLVMNSYVEKFLYEKRINITSLLYYMFFRVRFILNRILPYD